MFLTNKYSSWYFKIINAAVASNRTKTESYYERHHIIPRSMQGGNAKHNLVLLTAKEHYVCHLLLTRMIDRNSTFYPKMLHAFMLMKGSNQHQRRYTSSMYERLKVEYSAIRSAARRGKPLSTEHKERISNTLKQHAGKFLTDKGRKTISEKAKTRKRKPFSDEYKAKMSAIMKERNRWRDKSPD